MLLEDVLLTAGMRWDEGNSFVAISADEREVELTLDELLKSYLVENGDSVDLYNEEGQVLNNILRIEKK